MTVRGVLTACFLALAYWGVIQTGSGIINSGLSKEANCNGSNMGSEDELGPIMQPGDRCIPNSGGHDRTYDQQLDYQRGERLDVIVGACCLVTGLVGVPLTRRLSRSPGPRSSGVGQ
jgi:hypothetical protein